MAYHLSSKQENSKIPVPFRLRLSDAGKAIKDTRDQSDVSSKPTAWYCYSESSEEVWDRFMDEFFTADDEQCGNTCETCKERSKLQHGKSKNPVWIQPLNMFVSPCEAAVCEKYWGKVKLGTRSFNVDRTPHIPRCCHCKTVLSQDFNNDVTAKNATEATERLRRLREKYQRQQAKEISEAKSKLEELKRTIRENAVKARLREQERLKNIKQISENRKNAIRKEKASRNELLSKNSSQQPTNARGNTFNFKTTSRRGKKPEKQRKLPPVKKATDAIVIEDLTESPMISNLVEPNEDEIDGGLQKLEDIETSLESSPELLHVENPNWVKELMEKKREAERKREAAQSNPIENIIPPVVVVSEKSGTEDNVSVVAEISNCSNSAATELDVAETVLGDDLVIPDVDFATQQYASVSETGSIDATSSNKGDESDTEFEVEDAGSVTQRYAESEYHFVSSDAGSVMQRCSSDSESNPMDVGSVTERDLSDIEPDPVDVRSWMEGSSSNVRESADTSHVDDSASVYVLRNDEDDSNDDELEKSSNISKRSASTILTEDGLEIFANESVVDRASQTNSSLETILASNYAVSGVNGNFMERTQAPDAEPCGEAHSHEEEVLQVAEVKRRRLKKEADKKYLEEMARQQLGDRRKMRFQNAIEKHARPGCKGVENSSDQIDTDSEDDFLSTYCILKDSQKILYAKVFSQFEDSEGSIDLPTVSNALRALNLNLLKDNEMEYILKMISVFEPSNETRIDQKTFNVIAAFSERLKNVDKITRDFIGATNFGTMYTHAHKTRNLFERLFERSDRTISVEQFIIELEAGGVSAENRNIVAVNMNSREYLDFLDFVIYYPLMLFTHENIMIAPL